ncbi:hypothetical protein QYF61_002284 [Mycteria americana]|uniref:Uncharacterized protein n=1 Tax=Mycteria americana TaxID=33587 RepID=A0AAN7NLG6_MYCAM|nr:hypothetical protein QYF61_002284 [Mycteria americana]
MVSTRQKTMASLSSAPTTTDGASRRELRWGHAAGPVSGCRLCPTPGPVPAGSSEPSCGRSAQAEELLRFVAELREEARRLRSIRECERGIDCWNRSLPPLGQAQQADRTHDTEDPLSSLCLAEHGDLRDRRQRQQAPVWCSRCIFSVTTPPSQVPSHNRYEALQVEGNNDEDDGSSSLEVPPREGAPLDLLFVNREGLVGDVTVGGHLRHSDHKMTELLILGGARKGASRTAAWDFWRAAFSLFRRLVDRVLWEAVLKGKGVQEGWTFFKKEILKAQEQAVPICQKTSQKGGRPAWLNRELWLELRKKRRVYDLWKKGQATQEDYKDVMRFCREKIRRAKAHLELNLPTAVKDNKKMFL